MESPKRGKEGGKLKFKLNKTQLSKKRKQDIFMMVGAIVILFVLVPLALHLITTWNDSMYSSGVSYTQMDEDYFTNETVKYGSTEEEHRIFSDREYYTGTFHEETSIIWNEDDSNSIIIGNTLDVSVISFITIWDISDLLNNNTLSFKITLNNSKITNFYMMAYPVAANQVILDSEISEQLYHKTIENNRTFYFNLSTLDLYVDRINSDNGRIVFTITTDDITPLETADTLDFNYEYYKTTAPAIPTNTILKYGAGIIGIILIGIGFVSTPWWNPSDKSVWFDKLLGKIFGFFKPKRKGGKK